METLLKQTYEYRVETEEQIEPLIDKHKELPGLITFKTTYKTKKEKGEIIDDWYIVTISHAYIIT